MPRKITSPEDLKRLRDQARSELDLRSGPKDIRITVHMGTCGIAAGAREVLSELLAELAKAGVQNVTLQQAGCVGLCDQEPMLTLADKSGQVFRYGKLDASKARSIVRQHVLGGTPVVECLIKS
jgi:NADP-reducing hydrogenase subunit HndB